MDVGVLESVPTEGDGDVGIGTQMVMISLENAAEQLVCKLDTREGKLLRLELQFKDDPLLELKRKNSRVVSTLRRGYSYNEVKVYTFLRFTRMVNISSAGIGISE